MTKVLDEFDAARLEHVATLRAQGRFLCLDASVADTSTEEVSDVLGLAGRDLAPPRSDVERATRPLHVDLGSIGFALRCCVGPVAPGDPGAARVRPILVHVVVTADHLLTLHAERLSLSVVTGFHVHTAEWRPGRVDFLIDGRHPGEGLPATDGHVPVLAVDDVRGGPVPA